MLLTSEDAKKNFDIILKLLDYEDAIIEKNDRVIAKIVKHTTSLDDYDLISEKASEYTQEDTKVTYDEFLILTAYSDNRYELIDGDIYMLASPKTTHQQLVGKIYVEFYKWFEGKVCTPFISHYDITLKADNKIHVVQPDLGVICDLEEYNNENDQYMGVPALVVEVISKSSRNKDLIKKLNIYMKSGIQEYWIVDPRNDNTKVYQFEDYEVVNSREFNKGNTIESFIFKGLKVKW